jgi:hypothetical protein
MEDGVPAFAYGDLVTPVGAGSPLLWGVTRPALRPQAHHPGSLPYGLLPARLVSSIFQVMTSEMILTKTSEYVK